VQTIGDAYVIVCGLPYPDKRTNDDDELTPEERSDTLPQVSQHRLSNFCTFSCCCVTSWLVVPGLLRFTGL
jgi:hypothetical protein